MLVNVPISVPTQLYAPIGYDEPEVFVICSHPDVAENTYLISTYGRVYSIYTRRFLNLQLDTGYARIELAKSRIRYPGDTKGKKFQIHVLVAYQFCHNSDPENKYQVNHINGLKTFNFYKNLEWVTPYENIHHAIDTGLTNTRGEDCMHNKFPESTARFICECIRDGLNNIAICELIQPGYKWVKKCELYSIVTKIRSKGTWKWLSDMYF